MTYIKKHLPDPETLQAEYDRDPDSFVTTYMKYEIFFGTEESKKLLDKLIESHTKK